MPTVGISDLARLRTTRHATLLALSVYHPASIWTGRVNGLQTTGDTTITVDGVVQTVAPRKNYLVKIGSTPGGSEYGTTRFLSYSAPTLTVGVHNCSLPDDAYVTVCEEIKPTAIHFSISASDVVTEDGNIAYTNENIQYMPLACIGCPAVAYIDPATGLATVNSYSSSVAFGGALSTYAWTFPSGTPATSATAGTSGVPVAVTWNTAGEYYVRLTVTDANGKTHTRYTPVFIHDEANPPYRKIEVSGLSGDAENGVWQCSIKVMESTADTTAFPEQALCVLSAEDWYGTEKVSIGGEYSYRENIIFTGYIRRGTVTKNPFTGYVEFELESVSGVMDNIWELAHTLENTAGTPSGWHQLKNMTFNLAAHHLLTQHSTISEITDCYIYPPPYTRNFVDANDASLKAQLQEACCAPVRSRVGCSRQGMLYIGPNPQLLISAERTNTNILQTTFADIREIDFGDELQEKQTSQIDFAGENSSDDPVFSLAPATPWQTGQSEKIDGIRVDNQADANNLSGLYEGWRNNSFADVVISWRGNYRIFDTHPAESLQVSIAANQNARGIVWSNQRCWIKSVSMDYTPGILTVTTTVEKDVIGAPGVPGEYPTTPPVEPPPTYPPVEPPIEPPPVPPIPQGKGNLLYASSLKGMAKCVMAYGTDGTDGAPVWTAINGTAPNNLTGNALKIRGFNLDPWSVVTDHFTAAYAMTDDGFYRCTGLPDAPIWTHILSLADAATLTGIAVGNLTMPWSFTPSVLLSGFVMCSVYDSTTGRLYILWSLNNGTTWNANTSRWIYSNEWLAAGLYNGIALHASSHVANTYYATTAYAGGIRQSESHTPGDVNPVCGIWRSSGGPNNFEPGGTYGPGGLGNNNIGELLIPFCNSSGVAYADDDTLFLSGTVNGGPSYPNTGTGAIRKFTTYFTPPWSSGYTAMEAGTTIGEATMGSGVLYTLNMFNDNALYIWTTSTLWVSANGGSSWTKYTSMAVGGRGVNLTSMFNVPVDALITFLTGNPNGGAGVARVGMTIDRGATWTAIDNYGTGNALDTVLGLAAGDCDQSQIMVDYYKP